jgi:hypothetical protein
MDHSLLIKDDRSSIENEYIANSRRKLAEDRIRELAEELILTLISSFGEYQQDIDSSVLKKLAADTKFMRNADELYNNFKECYAIALKARVGPNK